MSLFVKPEEFLPGQTVIYDHAPSWPAVWDEPGLSQKEQHRRMQESVLKRLPITDAQKVELLEFMLERQEKKEEEKKD